MSSLEKDLSKSIGIELHELAWYCDYPMNPSIALWSFFEGFRDYGVGVKLDDKNQRADFNIFYYLENNPMFLQTSLSYEEVLTGWKNSRHPKGSPHALYDSICIVFDNMEDSVLTLAKNVPRERNNWFCFRNGESKKIRQKMEDYLLPYFLKHHEHMLLPVNGKIPELKEPLIFSKIVRNFPMQILEKAISNSLNSDGPHLGPCSETLLEIDLFEDLSEDYYLSEFNMMDLFFGKYLHRLSEEKGYPLWDNPDDPLRSFVVQGDRAFKHGNLINWAVYS